MARIMLHTPQPITLTVGLPLYNAGQIAWLAMESLCRQNIPEHEWELIVVEEQNDQMFGERRVWSYASRLEEAGCKRIAYFPLDEWIRLSAKWMYIVSKASDTSMALVLQASDCWSPPDRLSITWDLIYSGADWVHCYRGIFYDIATGRTALYEVPEGITGCDMAANMEHLHDLYEHRHIAGNDKWLYDEAQRSKGSPLIVGEISSHAADYWRRGLNTDGLNALSENRKMVFGTPDETPQERAQRFSRTDYWSECTVKPDDHIPLYVMAHLRRLVPRTMTHRTVRDDDPPRTRVKLRPGEMEQRQEEVRQLLEEMHQGRLG